MNYSNLTLTENRPIPADQVERYIGTSGAIVNADGWYEPCIIVSAKATDDPRVLSIAVVPGLRA